VVTVVLLGWLLCDHVGDVLLRVAGAVRAGRETGVGAGYVRAGQYGGVRARLN
jgi:hypothetical protein